MLYDCNILTWCTNLIIITIKLNINNNHNINNNNHGMSLTEEDLMYFSVSDNYAMVTLIAQIYS